MAAAAPPPDDVETAQEEEEAATMAPPLTLEEQLTAKKKAANLDGVELRFITASGKFTNKKEWHVDLPPAVLTEDSTYRYLCAAMVEKDSNSLRARPGVTITFRAFDEDGRLQMEVSNSVPYKGGYYYYEDVHLECMPWTLQLLARLTGDSASTPPLFEHSHVITTQSGRRPAPPRPVVDGHEMDEDSEGEGGEGPATRRKGHPMRSCGPKDMAAGQSLVKITGKKDLPRLIKKRKALRKNRRWHLFEGIVSDRTRTIFSRVSFQRELLAFMNMNSGSSRQERRRVLMESRSNTAQ